MKCKLCKKDKNIWAEMQGIKPRKDDDVNQKVDVCNNCIDRYGINRVRKKLIRKGF